MAKNSTMQNSNGSNVSSSIREKIVSDIIIIDAYHTNQAYESGDEYLMSSVNVSQLQKPVVMVIPTDENSTQSIQNSTYSINSTKVCSYFNTMTQEWEPLQSISCPQDQGINNTMKCCSTHMSQFAVFEIIQVSETSPQVFIITEDADQTFVKSALIILDAKFVFVALVIMIISCNNGLIAYKRDPKIDTSEFNSLHQLEDVKAKKKVEDYENEGGESEDNEHQNQSDEQRHSIDDIEGVRANVTDAENNDDVDKKKKKKKKKHQDSVLPPINENKQKKKKKKKPSTKQPSENQDGSEGNVDHDGTMTKGEVDDRDLQNNQNDLDKSEDQFMSSAKALHMDDGNQSNDDSGIQGINHKKNDSSSKYESSPQEYKPMSFSQIYCLHLKSYNRLTGAFFVDAPFLPRLLKELDFITQLLILLCLNGVFSHYVRYRYVNSFDQVTSDNYVVSIIAPMFIMRVVQIIMMCLISRSRARSKAFCRNVFAAIILVGLFAGAHILSLELAKVVEPETITKWQTSFIVCLAIEIVGIDFFLMPIGISIYISCRSSRTGLSPAFE